MQVNFKYPNPGLGQFSDFVCIFVERGCNFRKHECRQVLRGVKLRFGKQVAELEQGLVKNQESWRKNAQLIVDLQREVQKREAARRQARPPVFAALVDFSVAKRERASGIHRPKSSVSVDIPLDLISILCLLSFKAGMQLL